jgi:hypothetical protein
MHRPRRSYVLVLAGLLAVLALASESQASYSFEFVTTDYAMEGANWGFVVFKTVCTNTGTQADTLRFSITANAPSGWFADYCLDGKCYFGNAGVYFTAGESDTIDVEVFFDDVADMGLVTLTAYMKSLPTERHSETYAAWNQLPSILIVDDDDGQAYEAALVTALADAGYPGRVWDADSLGRPGSVVLDSHWMVFWTTAAGDASYLLTSDEDDLANFLAGGGTLFLASAEFLSSRSAASSFITDYLHISSWTDDTGGSPMAGVTGDPISDGMSLDISGGPVAVGLSDSFVLGSGPTSIFSCGAGLKGLRVEEGNHKAVFLAFPFENVSTIAADPNNQDALIANVMAWFEPPVAGVPTVPGAVSPEAGLVLRHLSGNPFAGSATLAFSVPGGSADALVAVYDVGGRMVKMLLRGGVGSAETSVTWDGTDSDQVPVSAGLYFCRLSANGAAASAKLLKVN